MRFGSAAVSPLTGLAGSPDSFRLTKVVEFVRYIVRRHEIEASRTYAEVMLIAVGLDLYKRAAYGDDCVRDILHGFVPIVGIVWE